MTELYKTIEEVVVDLRHTEGFILGMSNGFKMGFKCGRNFKEPTQVSPPNEESLRIENEFFRDLNSYKDECRELKRIKKMLEGARK